MTTVYPRRQIYMVRPQEVMLMRQSWFGISSCLAFLIALALAFIAWFIIDTMKPTRRGHMDMSGVAIQAVAVITAALIALVQLFGIVLGIVGLRQNTRARSAAKVGLVLNGAGVLCTIITALVKYFGFGH